MSIPDGYYPAVAVPVEGEDGNLIARWGEAKTGTKQILVYFEIVEGPHKGTRLPWFGYFTKDTYKRTIESLRYAGFKGDDLQQLGPLDQVVSINVQTEEYDGKTRQKIAWVNAPNSGAIKLNKPMSRNDIRDFAAQMRRHLGDIPSVDGERFDRSKPRAAGGDEFDQRSPDPEATSGWGSRNDDSDIPF